MDFLVGAGAMLALDSIYLSTVAKPMWQKMIPGIQGSPLVIRTIPAMAVYILMSFAIYYFVIAQRKSIYDAALLGLVIYGVFDLTNMAVFKNYKFIPAIVDMLWGGILFAATAWIVKLVFRR